MSSTYRKIEYPCDCGCNYGSCSEINAFAIWDYHTAGTFSLYNRHHGKWEKLVTLDQSNVEWLRKVLDCENEECTDWTPEDWEAFKKIRL